VNSRAPCFRIAAEHRRHRVLPPVFRTRGVPPIVPAVDRSDATGVQRGLTALTKSTRFRSDVLRGPRIDSSRQREPNLARPVIAGSGEFATLIGAANLSTWAVPGCIL
jgi:hypothetical protein